MSWIFSMGPIVLLRLPVVIRIVKNSSKNEEAVSSWTLTVNFRVKRCMYLLWKVHSVRKFSRGLILTEAFCSARSA